MDGVGQKPVEEVEQQQPVAQQAPPPPQPEKVAQEPNIAKDADATTKRADVENYGTQQKDKILNDSAGVAGAIGAQRAYTSGAEKVGFAPRTPESATAARVVADTINAEIKAGRLPQKYNAENNVVGAAVHKDGSVTVSFSGDGESTKALQDQKLYERKTDEKSPTTSQEEPPKTTGKPSPEEIERLKNMSPDEKAAMRQARRDSESQLAEQKRLQQAEQAQRQKTIDESPTLKGKIQENLNKAFEGNTTVKRDGSGNVAFEFGKTQSNLEPRPATQRTPDGVEKMQRTADNCAAGKMYQSENSQNGKNPVVGADEVWRTDPKGNTHQDPLKANNHDGRSMCPCSSCATNADKVKGNNTQPNGMTVRSAVQSGATGAAIAGVTSTLTQAWDNGKFDLSKVDAGKVAGDSAVGAGTAIAGEAIERAVTPAATKLAERVLATPVINKAATATTEQIAKQALTTGESKVLSSTVGKLAGAGVAGGVIGAGMEAWNQRDNFGDAAKRPDAVGAVVSQAAIGVAAGVAGAQAGAMIGSFIPVPGVGTVVGAAVGFGVGYLASATGADKAIAQGVSSAYKATENFVSGAASKLGKLFGW